MTMQALSAPQLQRIGKIKGEILRHAIPREVLGLIGDTRPIPKNAGDTVIYRRFLPVNATSASPNIFFANGAGDRGNALANQFLSAEGVTPNADALTAQDITVVLNEYTVLFGYTKRTADLYEDDIPGQMKLQVGERLALVREMVRFGVIKGGTNKFYGGTGTSRATVNGKLTLQLLRKISRSLKANHGDKVTEVLKPSTNFGTSAVEPSFFVFVHTDCESDVRDIPKFTPVAEYGTMKPVSPYELGKIEEFRVIASPELISVQDSGAAVGALGLYSTTGSQIDTYQVVVAARDAWGDIALRGSASLEIHDLKPGQADKNDPTGQRGYMGATTYYNAVLLNQLWVAVAEVGVTAL